jgi:hypothetical protein
MAFELPPLPYDYAALEPHVDARTMEIHHDKHHQAYVDNLFSGQTDRFAGSVGCGVASGAGSRVCGLQLGLQCKPAPLSLMAVWVGLTASSRKAWNSPLWLRLYHRVFILEPR